MAYESIVVKATRDDESGVWFVEHSDLPGLNVEADSLEELVEKLPNVIQDLLEAHDAESGDGDDGEGHDRDVPISLVAYAHTRVRVRAAA